MKENKYKQRDRNKTEKTRSLKNGNGYKGRADSGKSGYKKPGGKSKTARNAEPRIFSKSKQLEGTIVESRSFAFFRTDIGGVSTDILVPTRSLKNARHGDKVICEMLPQKPNQKPAAKVIAVEKVRPNRNYVGTINGEKDNFTISVDDARMDKILDIEKDKLMGAKSGEKVVFKRDWNNGGQAIITEILGKLTDRDVRFLSIIRQYDIYEPFPDNVIKAAKDYGDSVNEEQYKTRVQFFDHNVFTIDGEDARDFDDAVMVKAEGENTRVWVHIADVSEYVKKDNVIDKEAFNRATSVYFPDRVIPMLPENLSNGLCSLNPNVIRLTLTCEAVLDKNFKVIEHKIYESAIKSKYRMTYTKVQGILDGDSQLCEQYKDIANDVVLMNKIAKGLEAARTKRGEISLDIPESYIKCDENGKLIDIVQRPMRDSEKLIESLMILANEVVAEHYNKKGLPFVYRVHEEPDEKRIAEYVSVAKSLGANTAVLTGADKLSGIILQKFLDANSKLLMFNFLKQRMLRSMRHANYNPQCLGHFGLGSEFYCHFTSPIRRYPDLTIHGIIKKDLKNQLTPAEISALKIWVAKSANQSSEREECAEKAERDMDDMLKAEYMEKFVGSKFKGRVVGMISSGFFIELENTVEGFVSFYGINGKCNFVQERMVIQIPTKTLKMGDEVEVELISSDPETRRIDFKLI